MALYNKNGLSISSLVLMQQTMSNVNGAIYFLMHELKEIVDHLRVIESIYTLSDVQNKIRDGEQSYPPQRKGSVEREGRSGSEVEFR
jgi:hypothetical protein